MVRTTLPRITPRRPSLRIKRSTVQRATTTPSRANCRHTLVGAVELHVGLPDTLNLRRQHLVAPPPGAAFVGFSQQRCMASIRRRDNLQDLAERLDPERIAMLVDEVLQDLSRRSVSVQSAHLDSCEKQRMLFST